MRFFKKLSALFSSTSPLQDAKSMRVAVQCSRCGETIEGRIHLLNDLSLEDGDGNQTTYFCRKVLMGTQRCFQRVEVELTFDENRKLLKKKITGGKFVET